MSDHSSLQSSVDTVESRHRARGYQMEMLEQSLTRNIIIAVRFPMETLALHTFSDCENQMDTGSGKTQMSVQQNSRPTGLRLGDGLPVESRLTWS